MSIAPSGLGSELIPQGFINQVEINQLAYGSVMMVADMLRTSGGNQIPWPTMNDVGNKGRIIGENTCVNTTPDPVTGQILFGAYKFTSDAILVPYELLEDEAVAPMLPQILSRMLGERLGRIKEEKYTIGTGNGEPQGIVPASTLGLTTAGPALSPDDIISLEHSVDPAYRNGAAYMMHDSIIEAVRLLKDNEGRYLWRAGLQDGRPDMLNGRSVYVNQEMDDTLTTGNKAMLFGQFSNFKIREVNNMRMYRLLERFRDCDQDAFLAFCRGDSRLITAGTPSVVHLLVG
jgi:HK97 family phage major capsid protein